MPDHRLQPRGIKPSATEGDVLTTTGGVTTWSPPSEPAILYPLTSKVAGGDAGLVFGGPDDDDMIFTEGPL